MMNTSKFPMSMKYPNLAKMYGKDKEIIILATPFFD